MCSSWRRKNLPSPTCHSRCRQWNFWLNRSEQRMARYIAASSQKLIKSALKSYHFALVSKINVPFLFLWTNTADWYKENPLNSRRDPLSLYQTTYDRSLRPCKSKFLYTFLLQPMHSVSIFPTLLTTISTGNITLTFILNLELIFKKLMMCQWQLSSKHVYLDYIFQDACSSLTMERFILHITIPCLHYQIQDHSHKHGGPFYQR